MIADSKFTFTGVVDTTIMARPDGTILARDLRGQKLRKTIDDIMMGDSANGSKGIS